MKETGSNLTALTCFKTYDVRGELGVNFDANIAYRIGYAIAQHFESGNVIIGHDARRTSPDIAQALARGICDGGSRVLDIGMAGTEEMYWAVTEFGAIAGVEVTASHNPINYNGLKIVKSGSRPLDELSDFHEIKRLAEKALLKRKSRFLDITDISTLARKKYVDQVLSFVSADKMRPLRVVVNSGNGAAGPTFDAIAAELSNRGVPIEFIRVHHQPNHHFPNGIPNPLLSENHAATSKVIQNESADFGIAFDGDFDRCFFFDGKGKFVPGEYVVGLIASIFLDKEPGAKIVHDPRVIWNTQDIISKKGGIAVQSKTGHAFVKQNMRLYDAVYGGEMSAHHYFRDFAYCDSGMIPWLLVAELVSVSGKSLTSWIKDRFVKFPSSGEINFEVQNASKTISEVIASYQAVSDSVDEMDGVSLTFKDWRFNLRRSNTEALVRLNIETKSNFYLLDKKLDILKNQIGLKI